MLTWKEAIEPSLAVGDHRLPCPACDRGPRDNALSVTVKPDGGMVAHCFRCGFVGTHRLSEPVRRAAPAQPKPSKATVLADWGVGFWHQCLTLSGVAVDYLNARNCVIPPADGDLRWHPAVKHPSGYTGPALVGLVTDAHTRKAKSLHRTWINADGTKATSPARLPLAGHELRNGVIRLWPDEAVTTGLGVAEGIETALSLAWGHAPVWALIDAGHLAKFPPLAGIESLVIACYNDPAGIAAARACSARWAERGVEVFVTRQEANDLNDVVQGVA